MNMPADTAHAEIGSFSPRSSPVPNLTGKLAREGSEYFVSGDYYDTYPVRWVDKGLHSHNAVISLLTAADDCN